MITPFSIYKAKMALSSPSIFTDKNLISCQTHFTPTHFPKPSKFPFLSTNSRPHFVNPIFFTSKSQLPPFAKISASFDDSYTQIDGSTSTSSSSNGFNVDDFLSNFEFVSLASAGAISLYAAIVYGIRKGAVFEWVGSKVFVWQCAILVASVVVGAALRRRRWQRVCAVGFTTRLASYGNHLLSRVEKLEEDLRSSATLIRVLSRQLEKLGDRVRATRKAQKEPIVEAASLAQKNSEATRALAAQEDILEKELGEIHKVLLAMQDQQQKQLDLILAIAKARNLFNTQNVQTQDQNTPEASKSLEDEGEGDRDQIGHQKMEKENETKLKVSEDGGGGDRDEIESMDVAKASQQ